MNIEGANTSARIMVDPTSDIGPGRAEAWGIASIPLEVLFGEEKSLNGVDMQLEEFYQHLVSSEKLPIIGQPDPEAFSAVLQGAKEVRGDVVIVTISFNLSGTLQSATTTKETYEYDDIYIVDSMQVTCTMLMMVWRGLKLAEEGKPGREIYGILETEKSHYCICATIGDLTYLEKGGRLSKVGAAAGSMPNLKSVITIANTGVVKLVGIVREQHGVYAKVLESIESDGGLDFNQEMCIGYTEGMNVLVPFKEYLEGKMDISGFMGSRIGIVISTHGGPGCAVPGAYLE